MSFTPLLNNTILEITIQSANPSTPVAAPTAPVVSTLMPVISPVASPVVSPVANPTPLPPPTSITGDDSRLIAYLGNWQACPTMSQISQYTHIVIAFAVTYTWNPSKNICSTTCEISTPPVCVGSTSNIVSQWQAAGKKVILSFGGEYIIFSFPTKYYQILCPR